MTDLEDRKAKLRDALFRKGPRDTVQIANYLGMKRDTCRRFLRKMAEQRELDLWDGRGVSLNNADLWNLPDQREPMDPMTRLKEAYIDPKVFVLHCQRLSDTTQSPYVEYYDVVVTVVPQTKTGAAWRDRVTGQAGWRAYSLEWGAGQPGFGDPRSAARCLASKVLASIRDMEETSDIYSIPASPGQMQATA